MPSFKTAVLQNSGQNHAYYQVIRLPQTLAPPQTFCTTYWWTSGISLPPVCLRQVQDVCALSGLVVSPSEGVVPSGGKTTLQVHFNPESVIKFDTRIEVRRLRGNKSDFVLKKNDKNNDAHEACLFITDSAEEHEVRWAESARISWTSKHRHQCGECMLHLMKEQCLSVNTVK